MQVPLEITYRDVEKSEALDTLVRQQVEKLERFAKHIVSCRIAIERTRHHFRKGLPCRIRLDLRLPPGHELVISREPGDGIAYDDLSASIHSVFESARRRVQELKAQQHGRIKTHADGQENRAFVTRMFPDLGYGFLHTRDGREIYFHRNSVLNDAFDRLDTGAAVRYAEEMGQEGPQATTVQVIEPPMARSKDTVRSKDTEQPGVQPALGSS